VDPKIAHVVWKLGYAARRGVVAMRGPSLLHQAARDWKEEEIRVCSDEQAVTGELGGMEKNQKEVAVMLVICNDALSLQSLLRDAPEIRVLLSHENDEEKGIRTIQELRNKKKK